MIKWTCASCKYKNYMAHARCKNCGKMITATLTEVDTNAGEETKEVKEKQQRNPS